LHAHRQGIVLLTVKSVTRLFATIYMLAGSAAGGLVCATALGLMPRFGFLASYTNNDMAAVFVLLVLTWSVVCLVKHRTTADLCIRS